MPRDLLPDWLASVQGAFILQQEQRLLRGLVNNLFGYHLLQIGSIAFEAVYLENCPVRQHTVIGPLQHVGAHQLEARPEALPIASDSIDAVILPHTLDFVADPRQVLREVERVLIPEGRLIISGFNPLSLWGLRRLLPGARRSPPWCGHFISYPRLQDWCSLLGFDVEQLEVAAFVPPLQHIGLIERLGFLESWGPRVLPWAAGIYVLKAVKRVSTLTPIRPRWRVVGPLGRRGIEPTTRGLHRGSMNSTK